MKQHPSVRQGRTNRRSEELGVAALATNSPQLLLPAEMRAAGCGLPNSGRKMVLSNQSPWRGKRVCEPPPFL